MSRLVWAVFAVTTLVFSGLAPTPVSAQDEDPSKVRPLAPGVLKVIPTSIDPRDTYSRPLPLPGLNSQARDLNYSPKKVTLHELGRDVVFFRDIWQYEFSFIGLRQTRIKMRYPDGTVKPENVWYLVYRIRDMGNVVTWEDVETDGRNVKTMVVHDMGRTFTYSTTEDAEGNPVVELTEAPEFEPARITDRNFIPHFTLKGWVQESATGEFSEVEYIDTDEPLVPFIQNLEDPNQKLYSKAEMPNVDIPLALTDGEPGVWGVAIWRNIDPRIDYVSVQVDGLTNAYRIKRDEAGKFSLVHKTLQLNFWRPGDEVGQDRDEVDFGIPLVSRSPEQVNICRRYRLPGPQIRCYRVDKVAHANVFVTELDAQVNLIDFTSALLPKLDQGEVPEEVIAALAEAGVSIDAGAGLATNDDGRLRGIPGKRWYVEAGDELFQLEFEPQFWRRKGEGIEFIRSLDSLWLYR